MAFALAIELGILAMLLYGISDFLSKIAVGKFDPLTSAKLDILFGTLAVLIYALIFIKFPVITSNTLLFILLSGIAYAFGWIAFYGALKIAKVSLVSPISSSWGLVPFILSILFLSNKLTSSQLLFSAAIFIGILFVTTKVRELRVKWGKKMYVGAVLAIVAMLGFGLGGYFAVFVINQVGAVYGIVFTRIAALILIIFYGSEKMHKEKFDAKFLWIIVLLSLIDGAGYVAYGLGLATGSVALVSVLITGAPLIVVLLAYFILKEKMDPMQYIGIILIVLGFAGLALL